MKLYDCATAPSPRRVRMYVAEKGIDLESTEVDLRNGEHLSVAFRELNPDCTVPVLELDDGTCLTEVIAICQYLEDLTPVEKGHAKGFLSKKGHIVLAGHNDPTAFRNMKVADLR